MPPLSIPPSSRRSLWLLTASISILFVPSDVFADDRAVLLEIAPLSNYTLVGWNASNTESICTWQRVFCDAQQRVASLSLGGTNVENGHILRGSLPQSIAQLDRLQNLTLSYNLIYGDFPASIFALPNIRSVFIQGTGLTVSFPANVSSTLVDLIAATTKVVSKIPDANWDQIMTFDLKATGVNCPLPVGFVSYFNSGKNLSECYLSLNKLSIDRNNMVCGQLHTSKLSCSVSPVAYKAQYFATDDVAPLKNFTASLGNFTLDFTDDEVLVFQTYRLRSGARKEYRREYVSFRLMPLVETYGPSLQRKYATLERPLWANFVVSPTRVRANSTKTNNLVTEFIFDLTLSDDGVGFVKVSNYVYNLGHVWIPSPGRNQKVSVFYVFSFRITHSKGDDAMTCDIPFFASSYCASNFSFLQTRFVNQLQDVLVLAKTPTVEISYTYGVVGSVDGVPLVGSTATISAYRLPLPLPSSQWLYANRAAGGRVTTNATDEEQSFSAPIEIFVPEFQDRFYYDPDISITLLFDPERLPPEATDDAIKVAAPIGLIVGIVVAVVVVIAGVTISVTVIFPYYKARNKMTQEEMESADAGSSSRPKSVWIRASMPQST